MKKAAFKFKSGSGAIFAFLILAFVFASIAAVVYVVISQSPSKTPQAALLPSNFAPRTTLKAYFPSDWTFDVDATGVSGRKGTCTVSNNFSCSMGFLTFVANEPVGYSVSYHDTAYQAFTVTGTTTAGGDGSATFDLKFV
ncbi:MAG: hypothetical protein AAB512_04745 [Patescibacteria group bacterium]